MALRTKSSIHGCGWVSLVGVFVGLAFFGYYYHAGLTTAHYDAKAHLVVARSIVDSVSPGYVQLGSHWLPLTHLLYLPFVLFDSQYRSGLLPSLLSVFCFALSGGLACRIARHVTGSTAAGVFSGLFLLANGNLQYLQSCPLTEPIYMALLLLAADAFLRWRDHGDTQLPWLAAAWATLGAFCRYEGWYFLAGILVLLTYDFLSGYLPRKRAISGALVFLGMFVLPMSMHFGYLYARTGDNFLIRVAEGNPAPFETYRKPLLALTYHFGELAQIAGIVPLLAGLAGTVLCLFQKDTLRRKLPLFLLWLPSLINASALYWGMIYRIRYSVLLLPAIAVFAGIAADDERAGRRVLTTTVCAAALAPWLSRAFPHEWSFHFLYPGPGLFLLPALATAFFCLAVARGSSRWPLLAVCFLGMQIPALQGEDRPILAETMEHGFVEADRTEVLAYLREHYDGRRILIDSQKLSPLIYDSRLPIHDFLYNEGDPVPWRRALAAPARYAGWICIQKGDELSGRLQVDPSLVRGYSLVVHNDWLLLYRYNGSGPDQLQDGRIS